ncbi:MAG TPA: PilZ domain-containing protein [Terriglobales bacterium]|nr:PilZ domain-containing protein [Terriglobales bacterium]
MVELQRGYSAAAASVAREKSNFSKRRRYRYEIHSLSYINIDESNGGIIRNLNEAGLCVQSVSPLQKDQQVQLRFELLNPRVRVGAAARVRWVNAAGLAGLEFVPLGNRSRQLIKDWLLTQLLLRGQRLFVSNSIFVESARAGVAATSADVSVVSPLTVALAPRPVLSSLDQAEKEKINPAVWARLVDSAALVAAVLLFSVIAAGMMEGFPDWLVCCGVVAATAAILSAVYWSMFVSWNGATPGNYLVQRMLKLDEGNRGRSEEQARFR